MGALGSPRSFQVSRCTCSMKARPANEYEEAVLSTFARELAANDDSAISPTFYHGKKYLSSDNQAYIVDVSAEFFIAGARVLVVVECKRYTRPVTREVVDEFWTRLNRIRASKGIIATPSGFTRGARVAAKSTGIALVTTSRRGGDWTVVSPGAFFGKWNSVRDTWILVAITSVLPAGLLSLMLYRSSEQGAAASLKRPVVALVQGPEEAPDEEQVVESGTVREEVAGAEREASSAPATWLAPGPLFKIAGYWRWDGSDGSQGLTMVRLYRESPRRESVGHAPSGDLGEWLVEKFDGVTYEVLIEWGIGLELHHRQRDGAEWESWANAYVPAKVTIDPDGRASVRFPSEILLTDFSAEDGWLLRYDDGQDVLTISGPVGGELKTERYFRVTCQRCLGSDDGSCDSCFRVLLRQPR